MVKKPPQKDNALLHPHWTPRPPASTAPERLQEAPNKPAHDSCAAAAPARNRPSPRAQGPLPSPLTVVGATALGRRVATWTGQAGTAAEWKLIHELDKLTPGEQRAWYDATKEALGVTDDKKP
jgi:hypothetical protein